MRPRVRKQQDGAERQVHGSANLIQTLSKNELIDDRCVKVFVAGATGEIGRHAVGA